MNNPPDTNQASEDELHELAVKFDMDEYGTVNENGGYLIGEVRKLIRTEKLKLLAEVREQTTIFKIKAHDKKGQPHLYEAGRGVPTEVLAKLEAEL